jgi:hypothetical protein
LNLGGVSGGQRNISTGDGDLVLPGGGETGQDRKDGGADGVETHDG